MTRRTADDQIISINATMPKPGQRLTVYAKFIADLQSEHHFFERNLGYSSWLQGKALNLARDACKRGQWGRFVGSIDVAPGKTMSIETATKLRKIANHVLESQAKIKSYNEMLKMVYPSYAKQLKLDAEDEKSADISSRKTKNNRAASENAPILPDRYQTKLQRILSESQKLNVGRAEVGMSPMDEIDLCRNCIRLVDSTINELIQIKADCEASIAKYPAETSVTEVTEPNIASERKAA